MSKRSPIHIPEGIDQSLLNLNVNKGALDSTRTLYSFVVTPQCMGEDCPAATDCVYGEETHPGRCVVHRDYIKAVIHVILTNFEPDSVIFENQLTEDVLFQIGMHLMPLYSQLCRFQIEEFGCLNVSFTSMHGPKIHPIYKEIREVIKLISVTWKSLGLTRNINFGDTLPSPGLGGEEEDEGRVRPLDPSMDGSKGLYYERMFGQGPKTAMKGKV